MSKPTLWLICPLLLTACLGAYAGDKVPITTSSEAALESYLLGRARSEKLRGNEARPHFAMAYLSGSTTQATNREFFEYLEAAVARVDKVTQRLLATMANGVAPSSRWPSPTLTREMSRRLSKRSTPNRSLLKPTRMPV